MTADTLPVAEVFGPTWQGEGRHAGRLCGFVRLGLCNLACPWCDTPYTWDRQRYDVAAECPTMRVEDIAAAVADTHAALVVLSGGEPLIHARGALRDLLDRTGEHEWHIETNGTIEPPAWLWRYVAHVNVSPKINTGDPRARRPAALSAWATAAHARVADFKFVACDVSDLAAVDALVNEFAVPRERVWIMPEGTEPEALLARHRELAPEILRRGYCTTSRLQTLLWANERGR